MTGAAPLEFEVLGTGEKLTVTNYQTIVAGYTGRDAATVQAHIDELAAIGIAPPPSVPAYYPVASSLVTQAAQVEVAGTNTSGEVEPVLVRVGGRDFLAVGSDHTDRDIERDSIPDSKAACVKPVSRFVVPWPDDATWDQIAARCEVDGAAYQAGTLASLRLTTEVLDHFFQQDVAAGVDPQAPLLIFGGTMPLLDGEFVAGQHWQLTLELPDGAVLSHSYDVTRGTHG